MPPRSSRTDNKRAPRGVRIEIPAVETEITPEEQPRNSGPLPSLRVVRGVSIHPLDTAEIHTFVDSMGRRNMGKGKALAVGSMACTFVSSREMQQMLEAKYDDLFGSRRRAVQLQRRLAKSYNEFVRCSARGVEDDVFKGLQVRHELEVSGDDPEDIEDIVGVVDVDDLMWAEGSFSVKGIDKFGRNKVGLDLSTNETLYDEMEATKEFLRGEGLNTDVIDPERTPHITVFEPFSRLGGAVLSTTEACPGLVTLEPPRMWVNSNEPTGQY